MHVCFNSVSQVLEALFGNRRSEGWSNLCGSHSRARRDRAQITSLLPQTLPLMLYVHPRATWKEEQCPWCVWKELAAGSGRSKDKPPRA